MVFDEDGTPTAVCPTVVPLYTSAPIAWNGVIVEHYLLAPFDFPERFSDAHHVSLHLSQPTTLEWFVGGRVHSQRMTRGCVNIMPQGICPRVRCQDETEFLLLALDPLLIERVAKVLGAAIPVALIRHLGIRDAQVEHISLALRAALGTRCAAGRLYGDALAVALVAHLLGHYAAHAPGTRSPRVGLPAYKLRRVIEYINDHLTSDLTLAETASVAEMNAYSFSRAFRQSTGISPHRYVMHSRIEKAKRLLMDERLPLVEVGMEVGFRNQSHFTTLFRKLTGVTPKVYRDSVLLRSGGPAWPTFPAPHLSNLHHLLYSSLPGRGTNGVELSVTYGAPTEKGSR
jgi:AraC family transcriptional regulator